MSHPTRWSFTTTTIVLLMRVHRGVHPALSLEGPKGGDYMEGDDVGGERLACESWSSVLGLPRRRPRSIL